MSPQARNDLFPPLPSYQLDFDKYKSLNKSNWHISSKDAVLLIYDMQHGYVDRYENPSLLVKNIKLLRDTADQNEIPVFYALGKAPKDPKERGIARDLWGDGIGADRGTIETDHKIIEKLAPRAHDTIIYKKKYSAFFETDLQEQLNLHSRNQLIICGIYAHHGCMVTAVEAYMRNIKVFYMADALGAHDEKTHDFALRWVADTCGQIGITNQLIAELR